MIATVPSLDLGSRCSACAGNPTGPLAVASNLLLLRGDRGNRRYCRRPLPTTDKDSSGGWFRVSRLRQIRTRPNPASRACPPRGKRRVHRPGHSVSAAPRLSSLSKRPKPGVSLLLPIISFPAQRLKMHMRPRRRTAQLDHLVRPRLRQVRRQIDAHLAQHAQVFALLAVLPLPQRQRLLRLQPPLLALLHAQRLALAQLGLLAAAG